ncbi:endoribonuclease Dcr-1 [Trichogramma pretiosum]|uniref:endoribonuclease Dcr-1 n=1 Tax=Trichogramma pretiosum TaxID=7493 RepID=UPI0006C9C1BA|nr:endoribonuclease Dcr-1 [Trichogramma pretiosum]
MTHHSEDLVLHTKCFTPREHQVELLCSAMERNIIICLGRTTERTFISTKLIQELGIGHRKSCKDGAKRILYLLENDQSSHQKAEYINQVTDFGAMAYDPKVDFKTFTAKEFQVLCVTIQVCNDLIEKKELDLKDIQIIIIHQCHRFDATEQLGDILSHLKKLDNPIKVIGFAAPLYNLTEVPGQLSFQIERIESFLQCQIETASDLLSIIRYSPKPNEYILVHKVVGKSYQETELRKCIESTMSFLEDHRYDLSEIYDNEFAEEREKMPNPVEKPKDILEYFVNILDNLGIWCADKAAFVLLLMIEKLKVRTPYDRHYLIFSLLSTTFVKIRKLCDMYFHNLTEVEKIYRFSTPKVLRMLEVIKVFNPPKRLLALSINNSEEAQSKSDNPTEVQQEVKSSNNQSKGQSPRSQQRRSRFRPPRSNTDPNGICGLLFVENALTAKVLHYLLLELSKNEDDLKFLKPLFTCENNSEEHDSTKEIEMMHRKQEEVLKKFRMRDCNLLICTSILEEGIDIPKCNLVLRFDFPKNYKSYALCKSRARTAEALHILLISEANSDACITKVADFHYIEKILLSKCSGLRLNLQHEAEANGYDLIFPSYEPKEGLGRSVSLNSAISLVNRYCTKLPSDTFTKLTPEWEIKEVTLNGRNMYVCSIHLPINSPLKYTVESWPMPTRALAKRVAALRMCIQLHKEQEIDDFLSPISKETFRAMPEYNEAPPLSEDEDTDDLDIRPGTTKRRQYYYKKIADALVNCKPEPNTPCYLYHINMILSCPLPEEQNTRGRKLYPPEESAIGFGILTSKPIPPVCAFPIYTRCGEVKVELQLISDEVVLTKSQIDKAIDFLNFTFSNVLRFQKYLMLFDPASSTNSYIIIPVKNHAKPICIDWEFIDTVIANRESLPYQMSDDNRRDFTFDAARYNDAVVMPWYRNQDQPQYFYVAEICHHLNPKSQFPGEDYNSFEEYYFKKYDIKIQNLTQPLLDVDHTSARLNFLTPRYVNRKGVALPTTSEKTKLAKRENLEQKQILVAELCAVHPFPASLWRQAVCLPCILYRANALLLADQLRREVAKAINLGRATLDEKFKWSPLDFGWSLADVIKKIKEESKNKNKSFNDSVQSGKSDSLAEKSMEEKKKEVEGGEVIEEITRPGQFEISTFEMGQCGTGSNDQLSLEAASNTDLDVVYASPNAVSEADSRSYSDYDGLESDDATSVCSNLSNRTNSRCLEINYTEENCAEAVDSRDTAFERENKRLKALQAEEDNHGWQWEIKTDEQSSAHIKTHLENREINEKFIRERGMIVDVETPVFFERGIRRISNMIEPVEDEQINKVIKLLKAEMDTPEKSFCNKVKPAVPMPKTPPKYRTYHGFTFDDQPNLENHSGPSPSLILQAVTMSNANDGINLERLETIGDSFLKYAITNYLYCTYLNIHEGKLSHLRSKQVSNLNLYRLGKAKNFACSMIATKFEPHDNWLPPCYYVPRELEQALIESGVPSTLWNQAEFPDPKDGIEIDAILRGTQQKLSMMKIELSEKNAHVNNNARNFIPYNLITQHSIPDKSIADCVEALIGAYLISCGPKGALIFMTYLGIPVLPTREVLLLQDEEPTDRPIGSTEYVKGKTKKGKTTWSNVVYENLPHPPSPLLYNSPNAEAELEFMLDGYDVLEQKIGYKFNDRSYLLQAFTHASYYRNHLTDCYQRLEFLGDAILDYLITRHLYQDKRCHSPGALTDLRSALVNNTIFASLAVRCGFHKYFRHLSPGLSVVIERFVDIQEKNCHTISEECCFNSEEAEDIEVPKALGDVFESVAGAIYLDSNMSLDAVWGVYYEIMKGEIDRFSESVPKSPIRELLELEPEIAKFSNPEKLADGRRVRVTVEIFGKGTFKGIGRNYRIAKCTAAKCALQKLKNLGRS